MRLSRCFPLSLLVAALLSPGVTCAQDAGHGPAAPACRPLPVGAALTVAAAVDLALCQQPQTREQWALVRAQQAQVEIAAAAWRPRLDGRLSAVQRDGQVAPKQVQSAELSASWLLFDGGVRSANDQAAQQLLAAAVATQDANLQAVMLAAIQAYHAAQAAVAQVTAATQAEQAAAHSLAAAEARYQAGVATPADQLQARTAWSQARLQRIRAEGEARNAQGALAYALGWPPGRPLMLAPALAPELQPLVAEVEALIADAQRLRPDLRAAAAQVKAAEASVDALRAQAWPTVSVSAGPTWQSLSGQAQQAAAVGLTLSVPIFTGYEQTWRVRQAEAQRDVRAAQQARLVNQVALDVWRAYHGLATATAALQASGDVLASAEQAARVALGRYRAGVGTVLDLLTAQAAEAAGRQQKIQAELDWRVYRALLAQALGALSVDTLRADDRSNE